MHVQIRQNAPFHDKVLRAPSPSHAYYFVPLGHMGFSLQVSFIESNGNYSLFRDVLNFIHAG